MLACAQNIKEYQCTVQAFLVSASLALEMKLRRHVALPHALGFWTIRSRYPRYRLVVSNDRPPSICGVGKVDNTKIDIFTALRLLRKRSLQVAYLDRVSVANLGGTQHVFATYLTASLLLLERKVSLGLKPQNENSSR